MDRDVWPNILRFVGYLLCSPFPKITPEHIVRTFDGILNRADPVWSREECLIGIRAALASDVDLTREVGFAHPDAVVREFLSVVEKRLSQELRR